MNPAPQVVPEVYSPAHGVSNLDTRIIGRIGGVADHLEDLALAVPSSADLFLAHLSWVDWQADY